MSTCRKLVDSRAPALGQTHRHTRGDEPQGRSSMQVVYERCAGLDVHKRTVVACVLLSQADRPVAAQVRTFGTMTAELAALSGWLREHQVQQVALESTGVYWWPVFNLLEADGHAVVLVNPQHVKAVPGH